MGPMFAFYLAICCLIIAFFAIKLVGAVANRLFSFGESAIIVFINLAVLVNLIFWLREIGFLAYIFVLIVFYLIFNLIINNREKKLLKKMMDDDISVAKKRIEEDPTMVAAYEKLGDCYAQQGEYELAIENYELAVRYVGENNKDSIQLKSKLKYIIKEHGDKDKIHSQIPLFSSISDFFKRIS